MATKSILKSVNLKTPTEIEGFVTGAMLKLHGSRVKQWGCHVDASFG